MGIALRLGRRSARGSATPEYLGIVVVIALLMLGLLAVREHRPAPRPPVNPLTVVGVLVRPAPVPRTTPARPRAPRPARPRVRRAPPSRVTVTAPIWAVAP